MANPVVVSSSYRDAARILSLLRVLMAGIPLARSFLFHSLQDFYELEADQQISRKVRRKFERDLAFLKEQGYEIRMQRKRGEETTYQLLKGFGPGAIFFFGQEELDALVLLSTLFAEPEEAVTTLTDKQTSSSVQNGEDVERHHPFAPEIQAICTRLLAALPEEQRKQFEQWITHPAIYLKMKPMTGYLQHRQLIGRLLQACSWGRQLSFHYLPGYKEEPTFHECVDPYHIEQIDGHFFLIGYHHERQKLIDFRLDRFVPGSVTLLPNRIDQKRRPKPILFRYWLDAGLARSGLSQRFLWQRKVDEHRYEDPYGVVHHRILVHAAATNRFRIIQQMLKYGPRAELIEPADLRAQLLEEVERMHQQYRREYLLSGIHTTLEER